MVLAGYMPFDDPDERKEKAKVKCADFKFHDEYWGEVSENGKDFIRKLLVVNPHERYTADQALAHPWVRGPFY